MNSTEAPQKIHEWLKAEYETTPAVHPQLDWGFVVKLGSVPVNVYKAQANSHLLVQADIQLAPEHARTFKEMPKEEKEHFANACISTVLKDVVNAKVNADPETYNGNFHVRFTMKVYFDDLTRQQMMDAVTRVHHFAIGFILTAKSYLTDHSTRP